jgi:hypothetical protein
VWNILNACPVLRHRMMKSFRRAHIRDSFPRLQAIPVSGSFSALSVDRNQLIANSGNASFGQQSPNYYFRLLILALAENAVPDALLRIHKIKRRPILVIKSAPNRMVVIDRNWIGNMHVLYCPAKVVYGFLKGELGRMDADRDQPRLYIFSRPTRGRKAAGAASRCRDTSRNEPERLSRATRCSSAALN